MEKDGVFRVRKYACSNCDILLKQNDPVCPKCRSMYIYKRFQIEGDVVSVFDKKAREVQISIGSIVTTIDEIIEEEHIKQEELRKQQNHTFVLIHKGVEKSRFYGTVAEYREFLDKKRIKEGKTPFFTNQTTQDLINNLRHAESLIINDPESNHPSAVYARQREEYRRNGGRFRKS